MKTFQRTTAAAILAVLAVGLAGCATQPQGATTEAPAADETVRLAADRDRVREATVRVLEDMYFDVLRPPRDPSRVDTLPMVSAYPFEFWRPDARTAFDKAESALHTIRRTVTVTLEPSGDEATTVDVAVRVERLDLDAGMNTAQVTEAYSVFGRGQDEVNWAGPEIRAGTVWIDLGRDPHLEQYVARRIADAL